MRLLNKLRIKYFLILLFIIHLFGVVIGIFYCCRTSFVGEVYLWSENSHEIIAITPVEDEILYFQNANDTLITDFRTFNRLKIKDNSNICYNIDLKNTDTLSIIVNGHRVNYFVNIAKGSKVYNSLNFLFKETPLLKVFILLWSLIFISIIIYKARNIKILHLKYKLYRFLLKKGNSKNSNNKKIDLSFTQRIIILTSLIILIPATYMRLADYPLSQSSEEGRRALVSLEMKLQDNLWVPTVCGEAYYNKPPLFNWLLSTVIENPNVEFVSRSISASILLLSGLFLFLFLRYLKGADHAKMVVLMYLSSIFVIGYVSMVLNLDTLFALLLLFVFYLNFHFAVKRKFWLMFSVGYTFTALAFMTKGFPALWFQMVSVVLALVLTHQLKKIFSLQHLIGLLILILIPGAYFLKYSEYGSAYSYLGQLLNETSLLKEYTVAEIIAHFLAFPSINMLAYAPALLLLPFVFIRKSVLAIFQNKRLVYLFSLVIIGSSVFAITPYYSPYYSLMFVPLVIDVLVSLIPTIANISGREQIYAFLWGAVFSIITVLRYDIVWYILLIFLLIIFSITFFNKYRIWILILLGFGMVLLKLIYPFYYFNKDIYLESNKNKSFEIARKYSNNKIIIDSRDAKINYTTIFYLTYYSKKIVAYSEDKANKNDVIYIGEPCNVPVNVVVLDSIPQRYWLWDPDEIMKGRNEVYPIFLYRRLLVLN